MSVNTIQIGGNHYKKNNYQHWDFALDTDMPYLIGCATKYVSRWRDKNGIQDLRKCVHYIAKADENTVYFTPSTSNMNYANVFCDQFENEDAAIIYQICLGNYKKVKDLLNEIIEQLVIGEVKMGDGA